MIGGHDDESDVARASDARVAALEAGIAEEGARIAEQDAKIVEQGAQIAALTAQVAKLTELQGRNSSNSHLPSSSDGPERVRVEAPQARPHASSSGRAVARRAIRATIAHCFPRSAST